MSLQLELKGVIRIMKKYISILSLLFVLSILLTSCTGEIITKNPARPPDLNAAGTRNSDLNATAASDYTLVPLKTKNDKCELYFNEKTTDIMVKVLSTGYEWTTAYNFEGNIFMGRMFNINYATLAGSPQTMSSDI